ncbi:hypothetical protein QCA50_010775 [Cerrena zonata]|uniref:Uncharacterized protein n=1 Tax=Cerrena zonata TaxID=2478898 RepID=A0AAW0FXM3_9APHY
MPVDCTDMKARFQHVFWAEHCVIASNAERPVPTPPGSGLDMHEDELFHLSLLTTRLWGQDNFWYLAFLPRYPSLARDPLFRKLGMPFDQLPIEKGDGDLFVLRPSVSDAWLQLQYCVVATYDILRAKFLPLVPLQTRMPPLPQSTNFHGAHNNEMAARRAAHQTRRIFLAWLCLIASAIASSNQLPPATPPAWFRALAGADVALPPFWLDKIALSPILARFSPDYPRRGMVVNMSREWGFWSLMGILQQGAIPLWLCFPHGVVPTYRLAKQLYPSSEGIARAKESFDRGDDDMDWGDDLRNKQASLPPLPAGVGSDHFPSVCPSSQDEQASSRNNSRGQEAEASDAISNFFRTRKEINDKRDLATYTAKELETMRARGRLLLSSSKVFEWDSIDVYPWFVREKVPNWDQRRVWESYTANQRVYDEFADEWDCFAQCASSGMVHCGNVGCQDCAYDHHDEPGDDGDSVNGRGALAMPPDGYEEGEAIGQGECGQFSFTRDNMESFMDVLKYRYGLHVPSALEVHVPLLQHSPVSAQLLQAVRAIVQEEALSTPTWRSAEVDAAITDWYRCIQVRVMVPHHVSDCHMPDEHFKDLHNAWNFSTTSFQLAGSLQRVYSIGTINSRMLGWSIAVEGRLALREILRRCWGPGNAQVIRALLERGMPFHILYRAVHPGQWTLTSLYVIPYRPEGYVFTAGDYRAYVSRRVELFKDPAVASAALRHGGIVW